MTDLLFYVFALLLIVFSVLVTTMPNLLHSALSLIASFFVTAALYLVFQMEFVALSQVMIYIGGIVIFCIIIILLTTGLGDENLFKPTRTTKIIGASLSFFLLMVLIRFTGRTSDIQALSHPEQNTAVSMDMIGQRLLASGKNGFIETGCHNIMRGRFGTRQNHAAEYGYPAAGRGPLPSVITLLPQGRLPCKFRPTPYNYSIATLHSAAGFRQSCCRQTRPRPGIAGAAANRGQSSWSVFRCGTTQGQRSEPWKHGFIRSRK